MVWTLGISMLSLGSAAMALGFRPIPSAGRASTARGGFVDYSASSEWEQFYQEQPETTEWHASIHLEDIAALLKADPPDNLAGLDILVVGCGNSELPSVLLQECTHSKIVLLDTSATCLELLEATYGDLLEYVQGDATRIDVLFPDQKFDFIVDKGLADAIFCGEGWEGPIQRLFQAAGKVLRPRTGKYLLVSYKLPSSTKDFLATIGREAGLKWDFDLPEKSNEKVGVSLARRDL